MLPLWWTPAPSWPLYRCFVFLLRPQSSTTSRANITVKESYMFLSFPSARQLSTHDTAAVRFSLHDEKLTETSLVHQHDADYCLNLSLYLVIKFYTNFIVSVFVLRIMKYDFGFWTLLRLKVPWRTEHLPMLTTIYDGLAFHPKTRQRSCHIPAGSDRLWQRWRRSPQTRRYGTPPTWGWAARPCGPFSWWCGPVAGTCAWSSRLSEEPHPKTSTWWVQLCLGVFIEIYIENLNFTPKYVLQKQWKYTCKCKINN